MTWTCALIAIAALMIGGSLGAVVMAIIAAGHDEFQRGPR